MQTINVLCNNRSAYRSPPAWQALGVQYLAVYFWYPFSDDKKKKIPWDYGTDTMTKEGIPGYILQTVYPSGCTIHPCSGNPVSRSLWIFAPPKKTIRFEDLIYSINLSKSSLLTISILPYNEYFSNSFKYPLFWVSLHEQDAYMP